MSFAENLKQVRKDKGLSQEELAEMLSVSRQAVGKWEAGQGYPEVEKLIELAGKLSLSLDWLFFGESSEKEKDRARQQTITIYSKDAIVNCVKVRMTRMYMFSRRKNKPNYALYGANSQDSFWGESNTILGLYATKEDAEKEMREIIRAIKGNKGRYDIKYAL